MQRSHVGAGIDEAGVGVLREELVDWTLWNQTGHNLVGALSTAVGSWCAPHGPLCQLDPARPLPGELAAVRCEHIVDGLVANLKITLALWVLRTAEGLHHTEVIVDRADDLAQESLSAIAAQDNREASQNEEHLFHKELRPLVSSVGQDSFDPRPPRKGTFNVEDNFVPIAWWTDGAHGVHEKDSEWPSM